MKHPCAKRPMGLQRLVRKNAGRTGVVVHGWFPLFRFNGPREWVFVPVGVEGGEERLLAQAGKKTEWFPVEPGPHRVYIGDDVSVPEPHTYELELTAGQQLLIVFSTPRSSISGRFAVPVFCEPVEIT